jgi:hypothetical protein
MKTRIRSVRLRVQSSLGAAGALVRFDQGLNVIRGRNSRGKTQTLQAIIYSLGLEGMFGPAHNSRLGSAFTHQLFFPPIRDNGAERTANVFSSWCAVELENESGQILTAQRSVTNPYIEPNLIHVWRGPAITAPENASPRGDYFVRIGGAAQRERGFHTLLTRFLGWQLPQVPRYSGGDVPLYLEVIAPFLYVDQRAWGSSGPRTVTHYQIREPTRRAAEFLLGFAGPESQARRYSLEASLVTFRSDGTVRVRLHTPPPACRGLD